MAWAIKQAEAPETRGQWEAFTRKLAMTRDEAWGKRPWPNAIDNEAFQAHVSHMANTFANSHPSSGVRYEGRKTDPLAAPPVTAVSPDRSLTSRALGTPGATPHLPNFLPRPRATVQGDELK